MNIPIALQQLLDMQVLSRPEELGNKLVQVLVGASTEPVHVHERLLVKSSDFFDKAINGRFKEQDGVVRLPTQDVKHFQLYTQWLYRRKIGVALDPEASQDDEGFDARLVNQWETLVDLYILGDVLQDEEFCNAAMDAFLMSITQYRKKPIALASRVEAHLTSTSPFYRVLLDIHTTFTSIRRHERQDDSYAWDTNHASQSFWVDVARNFARRQGGEYTNPTFTNRCHYHIHSKTQRCKTDVDQAEG